MNELRVFENQEFGKVRTVTKDGEPWFVAADVCRALGYSNSRKAIHDHVDAEDKNTVTNRDGIQRGNPNMVVINESGLYSLILSSKLPRAKEFKHWVTSEILTSIRKTGSYTAAEADGKNREKHLVAEAKMLNARSRASSMWYKFASLVPAQEHKQLCASYGTQVLTGGERVLPLPHVERTYSAQEVGDMYGISAHLVGRIANQNGLKTSKYGHLALDKSRYSNKEVETWRYNENGAKKVGELLPKGI